ncbi:hypothetical protein [Ornithinimicrobium flavum]|uniref:hypothetical protein n=1 Tax=Ornithinimicrobium flavum TaxID=1288636 RepID=UPI00106F1DEE|nr:hypothetical protein [Ornithinimicrobium flavum]
MPSPEPTRVTTSRVAPTPRQLSTGRAAAALVALEAVIIAGFAVFYLYELAIGEGQDLMVVIMSVVTMVVFVIGLSYTAKGLLARHPRAQAPAIAFNFLLVPLGIAMFQFAPWWLAAGILVLGVTTIAAVFLMGRLED